MKVRLTLTPVSLGVLALLLTSCVTLKQRTALLDGPYHLYVDYSRSVAGLLKAGEYEWVHYRISAVTFAGSETGTAGLSAVLVPFSPQASLEWLFQLEAASGYRPATFKELLAFGEAYPEVQRTLPVIALGSPADVEVTEFLQDPRPDWAFPLTQVVQKVETIYPFLGDGLEGRNVNFDWLDSGQVPQYYACFVKPG
jgi:hypothetical protein